MAALYSSSAARDERVICDLGTSGVGHCPVGRLSFVPRLVRRGRDWVLSSPNITSRARVDLFHAVTIVIFACINTSNNLCYGAVGAPGRLLLSGFLSALNFRFVDFDIRVPATCFAGAAFPFSVQIKNRKRVFPTFSLRAGSLKDGVLKFEPFFFPVVHADGQTAQSGEAAFERRGRYNIKELKVSSRYPFGFFTKGRDYDVESECVCSRDLPQEQMNSPCAYRNQPAWARRGIRSVYDSGYFPPDSARHVHWKLGRRIR
jgi:hypothetical protein